MRVYWSRVVRQMFIVDYERRSVRIVTYRYDRSANRLVPAEEREAPLEEGLRELEEAKRVTEREVFGREGYLDEINEIIERLKR